MANETQGAAIVYFRSAYGRLCRLCAQALHDGYHREAVYLASVGKSRAWDSVLRSIGRQHSSVDASVKAAHGQGLTTGDLLPIMREAKRVVESEWDVSIPLVSGG